MGCGKSRHHSPGDSETDLKNSGSYNYSKNSSKHNPGKNAKKKVLTGEDKRNSDKTADKDTDGEFVRLFVHFVTIISCFFPGSQYGLTKVENGYLWYGWLPCIATKHILKVVRIYCPGHAVVRGNEGDDSLATRAPNNRILDPLPWTRWSPR